MAHDINGNSTKQIVPVRTTSGWQRPNQESMRLRIAAAFLKICSPVNGDTVCYRRDPPPVSL
jgi:hypothetical protein